MVLHFDRYHIDTDLYELATDSGRVEIEPQVLELLIYLIENRSRLVTKDELHKAIWHDRFVSDSALSSLVKAARRALGDNGRDQKFIETRHGLGFRFRAEVRTGDTKASAAAAGSPPPDLPTGNGEKLDRAPAIAVLPFDNYSPDSENDILAAGVTEELITGLSHFRWFRVLARNALHRQDGDKLDVQQLRQELGVDYVVEGSVNRTENKVRIHAQLIDAVTGHHVWASRFDFDYDNVFSLLDRMSAQVVGALQSELLDSELLQAERTPAPERTAWHYFVQAQGLLLAPSRETNRRARHLLREAVALEPESARMHGAIALTHLWDVFYGWRENSTECLRSAVAAASRALALGPADSWALVAMGAAKLILRDHDGAIADQREAIAHDPNSALAHGALALSLACSGELTEALQAAGTAHRLSPADRRAVIWLIAEGLSHFGLGEFEAAIRAARRVVAMRPDYPSGYRLLAASAAAQGDAETASEAVRRLLELLPDQSAEKAAVSLPFRSIAFAKSYISALRRAGLPGPDPDW